jgi:hypothetical protein
MSAVELYLFIVAVGIFGPALFSLLSVLSFSKKMGWENVSMIKIAVLYVVTVLSGAVLVVSALKVWGV